MNVRRLAFGALVPAVIAFGAVMAVVSASPTNGSDSITVAVRDVFGYELLGSMTLNAWLALRHPDSATTRELPVRLARVHLALYGTIVVWFVTTLAVGLVPALGYLELALSIVLMVLSIWSFASVAMRSSHVRFERPRESVTRPRWFTIVAIAYIVASLALVACYLVARTPETDGYWTFLLMTLGLPWSHTLYLVAAVVVVYPLGITTVITPMLIAPIAVNVGLIVALLASSTLRTRVSNRFFRLGFVPRASLDEDAETEIDGTPQAGH